MSTSVTPEGNSTNISNGSEGNSVSTSNSEGDSVSTSVKSQGSGASTSVKPEGSIFSASVESEGSSLSISVKPEGSSANSSVEAQENNMNTSVESESSVAISLSEGNMFADQISPETSVQLVAPNLSSLAVTSPIRHQANPTSFADGSHLEIATPGDTEANQAAVTFQTLVSTISQANEGQLATAVGSQLGSGQVPKTTRRRSTLAAVAGRASSSPSLHPQYGNGSVRLVCWNLVYTILSVLLFM